MLKSQKETSELTQQQRNQSLRSFKTEQYESKIYDLSNQIKLLREKLHSLQNQNKKQNQIQKQIHNLQVQNTRLHRENKALRVKVQELEAKIQYSTEDKYELASAKSLGSRQKNNKLKNEPQTVSRQSSKIQSRYTATTTHLLRQLLAECNQPLECASSAKNDKLKDEFYEFKDSADCFQPWLSQLSKEQKIRLKRCLTRQKQLLWTSSQAELGCICPYNMLNSDSPQLCRMLIVLTNISHTKISKVTMSPLFAKDVDLTRQSKRVSGKWQYAGELAFNQQVKEELHFTINNVDFRCVQLQLSYEIHGQTYSNLLILPISKVKLFKNVAYSAVPPKCQRIERVFQFQKRVLSGVDRLSKLWDVIEGGQKVGKKYYWKISFLSRFFWIQAGTVEQKLMIGVHFDSQRALAQKVLQQYIFIFQKL